MGTLHPFVEIRIILTLIATFDDHDQVHRALQKYFRSARLNVKISILGHRCNARTPS